MAEKRESPRPTEAFIKLTKARHRHRVFAISVKSTPTKARSSNESAITEGIPDTLPHHEIPVATRNSSAGLSERPQRAAKIDDPEHDFPQWAEAASRA